MPSDEMAAEIEGAIDEMIASEQKNPGIVSGDAQEPDNKPAVEAASDEAEVLAAVAADDAAADKLAADSERASEELTKEEGGVISEAAKDAQEAIDDGKVKPADGIETTPVESPEISDETLARAVSVGIPVVDAKALAPFALESIIAGREAELEQAEAKAPSGPQERSEEVVDPFADLPKLDPEVHDPGVIAMFEKVTDIAKQQAEDLRIFRMEQTEAKEAAAAREEADLEVATQEIEQFFDNQVKGLGENFRGALGDGDFRTLDRGSPQFANREAIAGQMSVLISGYEAQGLKPPPRETVFSTAAKIVLGDVFQGVREKELAGTLSKQAGQHVQRPGGVQASTTKTPEEDAAAAVDEFLGSR